MHLPCILSRCDAAEGFTDDDVGGGRDCTSGIAHGSDVRQDNEIRRCSCASAPPLFHSDTYWKSHELTAKDTACTWIYKRVAHRGSRVSRLHTANVELSCREASQYGRKKGSRRSAVPIPEGRSAGESPVPIPEGGPAGLTSIDEILLDVKVSPPEILDVNPAPLILFGLRDTAGDDLARVRDDTCCTSAAPSPSAMRIRASSKALHGSRIPCGSAGTNAGMGIPSGSAGTNAGIGIPSGSVVTTAGIRCWASSAALRRVSAYHKPGPPGLRAHWKGSSCPIRSRRTQAASCPMLLPQYQALHIDT